MIEHKFFESQQSDESIILIIRRHWFELLPAFMVGLMVYFVLFLSIIFIPINIPSIVTGSFYNLFVLIISIFFLFDTVFLYNTWVLHYLHVAILTSEHFVEITQYDVFSRKISELGLDKIQDVEAFQKGMFAAIFNYGGLTVETAGEMPNFMLEYVGNPNKVSQKIMEVEEDYCIRHGIRSNGISGNANQVNNIPVNPGPVSPESVSQEPMQAQAATPTPVEYHEPKPGPIEYVELQPTPAEEPEVPEPTNENNENSVQ